MCTDDGQMVCLSGWSDPANNCHTPICAFTHGSHVHEGDDAASAVKGCGEHGECVRPQTCACEVGWEGPTCEVCVPLPGCFDGHCVGALDCVCRNESRYTGAACDIRKELRSQLSRNLLLIFFSSHVLAVCKVGCVHGFCKEPGQCM